MAGKKIPDYPSLPPNIEQALTTLTDNNPDWTDLIKEETINLLAQRQTEREAYADPANALYPPEEEREQRRTQEKALADDLQDSILEMSHRGQLQFPDTAVMKAIAILGGPQAVRDARQLDALVAISEDPKTSDTQSDIFSGRAAAALEMVAKDIVRGIEAQVPVQTQGLPSPKTAPSGAPRGMKGTTPR